MRTKTRLLSNIIFILAFLITVSNSFQYINTLQSYQMCYITISLSPFIQNNLKIDTDFKITLEMSTLANPTIFQPFSIPDQYNTTLNSDVKLSQIITWRLFNIYQQTLNYRLNINIVNQSKTDLQQLIDILYQRRINLKIVNKTMKFIASILSQDLSSGIILPFNMINLKKESILASDQFSENVANINYQMQPFMPTYWNQNDVRSVMLPWIPYFSRCSIFDQYIFINQILDDPSCFADFDQNNLKIQDQIPYFNNMERKSKCQIDLKCILEEKNNTSGEIPWWQSSNNILFYIYPSIMDATQFQTISKDDSLLQKLIRYFKSDLVPIYFIPDTISIKSAPIKIKLTLSYYMKQGKITIGQGKIQTTSSESNNSVTDLKIILEPITLTDGFNRYYLQYWTYFIIFITTVIIYIFFTLVIMQAIMKKNIKQIIVKSAQLMVTPLLKGTGLGIVICFTFLSAFFIFGKINKISFIVTSFDGYLSNPRQALTVQNGRVGLCLLFGGICTLYEFISQLYKIPTQIQSKIMATQKRKKSVLALKGTGKQFKIQQQTQQIQQIINHTTRIMNSKKHYTFVSIFILNIIVLYEVQLLVNNSTFYFAFVIPFIGAFLKMIYKYLLIKDLLITSIAEGSQACLTGFIFIKYQRMFHLFMIYFAFELYNRLVIYMIQLAELKIKYYFELPEDMPFKQKYKKALSYKISQQINQRDNYANYLMGYLINNNVLFIRVIFYFGVYLSQDQSKINIDGMIQQKLVVIQLLFNIALIFIGLIHNIVSMSLYPPINYLQMLEYGLYRFKTRTIRWGHDKFGQIHTEPYYKNVYNMGYSSQMYFYTSSILISLSAIWWGAYIVMRNSYAVFSDPAFMVILILVITVWKICSFICAILSSKLKIYNVQTQKTNIALDVIQLFLKKKDLLKYQNLQVVKQYFIKKNAQWIADNFFQIFNKADFLKDNQFLLNKYRQYLNIQRQKNMEAKKKQILMQKIQKDSGVKVISVQKKTLQKTIKPLVSRWLSLAKENLFLQNIIKQSGIKQIKKLENCQYCKINIYTQVIQKYPLYIVSNKFRIQNEGKPFSSKAFINFYSRTQQFKTTCLECIQRAKAQKNLGNAQKVQKVSKSLVLKWLFISRSRILHNSLNKTKKTNLLKKHGLKPKQTTLILQSMKSIKSAKSIKQYLQNK